MRDFSGKSVIVTGSSSGIGAAIARRFAASGANVVLNSRSRNDLESVAADLDADRTLICAGDVSDPAFAANLIDTAADHFGGLDCLVCNAGVAVNGPVTELEDADIDKLLDINVKALIYLARAAVPHLEKSGGSIVNTSSVSGLGGDWGMALYDASKGAVSNLTRALALELGVKGVRVNAVAPTTTRSDMSEGIFDNDKLLARFRDRIALRRPGEPEDIAGPVLFLASEDAGFVTGVVLPVDGGLSASNGQPNMMAIGD